MEVCLKRRWGYSAFQPGQKEAIQATLRGVDVIASLSGKYMVSQFPAVFLSDKMNTPAFSIIISPNEQALIEHQRHLFSIDVSSIYILTETLTEIQPTSLCFVLTKPETLLAGQSQLIKLSQNMKLVSIVIEDPLLVSQSYPLIREWFPQTPMIVLRDWRNLSVTTNIIEIMGLRSPLIIRNSSNRPHVYLSVKHLTTEGMLLFLTDFYCRYAAESSDPTSKPSTLIVVNTPLIGERVYSAISLHQPLRQLNIRSSDSVTAFDQNLIEILIAPEDKIFGISFQFVNNFV